MKVKICLKYDQLCRFTKIVYNEIKEKDEVKAKNLLIAWLTLYNYLSQQTMINTAEIANPVLMIAKALQEATAVKEIKYHEKYHELAEQFLEEVTVNYIEAMQILKGFQPLNIYNQPQDQPQTFDRKV